MDESTKDATPRNASKGAVRYLAPELIKDSNAPQTEDSDTFSFGMLMLECITKKRPFFDLSSDAAVIDARVVEGQYPPRSGGLGPEGRFPDRLWELTLCCWSIECERRPTMEWVHSFLSSN